MTQKVSVDELLARNKFNVDEDNAHIVIDTNLCLNCSGKPCLSVCPARRYQPADTPAGVQFDYVGCLECGACRVVCRSAGNGGVVKWEYPRGSFGLCIRYG